MLQGDYDVIVTKREPKAIGQCRYAEVTLRVMAHVGDGELLEDQNGNPIEIEAIDRTNDYLNENESYVIRFDNGELRFTVHDCGNASCCFAGDPDPEWIAELNSMIDLDPTGKFKLDLPNQAAPNV